MFRRRKKRLNVAVTVTSVDPTNVLSCNRYIRQLLTDDLNKNTEREAKIAELDSADSQYMTIIEMKAAEYEKECIQAEIDAAKRKMDIYNTKIVPLVEEWKETKNPQLVSELKMIAGHILPQINVFVREIPSDQCRVCFSTLENDEENTIMFCPKCANVINMEDFEICEAVDSENKGNSYVSTKNFIKALDAYQGSMSVYPPESVFTDIEKYCAKAKVDPKNLTSSDIKEILSSTGNSSHYNAVNYILYKVAGKPLPDISSIRDDIINDNRLLDREFRNICPTGSSINTQKKLYVLLRRRGVKCDKSDFRIPKTPEIDMKYNSYLIRIFDALGWDHRGII